ncbi:polysaccharide pyruvyl transferase family protein [Denitromonas iodatirespirans]|uniref:Polysaccharide pyruvyl transferase family protein n=1 Tax=Denitromonas iodatirespirans TaxID=2795389 RepID=A0A944DH48_DENI1|nr:polysaccharide pyruvyl transferase family protein [Denitromonas iodatirespirans]MBT0962763.1 polysaccharide pyruvyl transferase family protein [Denitromonas iodatirespirans]
MTEPVKTLTVGLLWHSISSDNLGVGALTLGQMAVISEAARRRGLSTRFVVIGTRGGTPYSVESFDVVGTAEFALRAFKSGHFEAISLLRHCDIVFDIGEGDSFSDIYGNKRLAIQVFAKLLVRLFRKPLVLSPQTIGPFKSSFGKFLGSVAMRAASRIYARDHLSMDVLQNSRYRGKSAEVIDVAFALPFVRPVRPEGGPVNVGLNVSGLLYNGGYSGSNEFKLTVDYRALIDGVCEYLLAQPGVDVYLVPHVISDASETEDDLRASQGLIQRYPALRLAPRFQSPSEAKSFIAGMDFFTGARMHACIAAFSVGVPVLPMAYSRKFNGLFNSLDYRHVIDCLALDTPAALNMFIEAFERRSDLFVEVEAGNRVARTKLETYTDQLSTLLPGARGGAHAISSVTDESGAKRLLRAVLPHPVAEAAKVVKRLALLLVNSGYDFWRYSRFSSSVFRGDSEEKLRALITIHYHSIEKGLSLHNPRPGFGVAAIDTLLDHLSRYLDKYGPAAHLSVPLNALHAYLDFNRQQGVEKPALESRVAAFEQAYTNALGPLPSGGGVKALPRHEIEAAVAGVGADFFMKRYSIRQFAPVDVPMALIEEAVRRAQKTPAVCNRQSGRAWIVSGSEDIARVLDIQKGARGFAEQVNKVIVVTSDLCNFQSPGERYQSWIDGGLFAMSLIYALHSLGLGSCCLNWSMEYRRDMELKRFLKMPQSETVIMLLAVGALPEELAVAESTRKPLEEVMVQFSA